MKTKLQILVVALVALMSVAQAQGTDAVIQQHCSSEWPSDFSMRAYCERQQREAVLELQQLAQNHGNMTLEAYKTALGGCVRDWPDDYQMQAYCLRQQIQGYGEISQSARSPLVTPTADESAQIDRHCTAEWPTDYQMQSYCRSQQLDGLAFLRAPPPTVPMATWTRALSGCRIDWSQDFQMQAYCVRQTVNP